VHEHEIRGRRGLQQRRCGVGVVMPSRHICRQEPRLLRFRSDSLPRADHRRRASGSARKLGKCALSRYPSDGLRDRTGSRPRTRIECLPQKRRWKVCRAPVALVGPELPRRIIGRTAHPDRRHPGQRGDTAAHQPQPLYTQGAHPAGPAPGSSGRGRAQIGPSRRDFAGIQQFPITVQAAGRAFSPSSPITQRDATCRLGPADSVRA
jgi:hypothetical protein